AGAVSASLSSPAAGRRTLGHPSVPIYKDARTGTVDLNAAPEPVRRQAASPDRQPPRTAGPSSELSHSPRRRSHAMLVQGNPVMPRSFRAGLSRPRFYLPASRPHSPAGNGGCLIDSSSHRRGGSHDIFLQKRGDARTRRQVGSSEPVCRFPPLVRPSFVIPAEART